MFSAVLRLKNYRKHGLPAFWLAVCYYYLPCRGFENNTRKKMLADKLASFFCVVFASVSLETIQEHRHHRHYSYITGTPSFSSCQQGLDNFVLTASFYRAVASAEEPPKSPPRGHTWKRRKAQTGTDPGVASPVARVREKTPPRGVLR